MSEQLTTLLFSVLIAVGSIGGVFGLIALRKNKKLAPVVEQVANVLPTVLGVAQTIITKGDAKDPANKTFDVLRQVAETAAKSVEQVAKKESHLTSEEKMTLAKENFTELAKVAGIEPSELDEKVVETLIENVVFHLGK
jgi:enamine deaminase RidA (YjgF/YER057c/UK114 family)